MKIMKMFQTKESQFINIILNINKKRNVNAKNFIFFILKVFSL